MEETGGEMLNDGVVSTTTTLSPMSPSATIASPSIAADSRNSEIHLPIETIVQRQQDANNNIETVVTPPSRESSLDVGGDENENDYDEGEIIDTNNTNDRGSPRSILPRDMILRVLYQHMMHNRARRFGVYDNDEDDYNSNNERYLRDLHNEQTSNGKNNIGGEERVLRRVGDKEAIFRGYICRFCFETIYSPPPLPPTESSEASSKSCTAMSTSDSTIGNKKNSLVAPCRCTGGSEWVHIQCLRRWQKQCLQQHRSSAETNDNQQRSRHAAFYCDVCTSPYQLQPPRPPHVKEGVLKRGIYLVKSHQDDEMSSPSSCFHHAVLLLWRSNPAFALVINKPLLRQLQPLSPSTPLPIQQLTTSTRPASAMNDDTCEAAVLMEGICPPDVTISWRRGGPVSGGRLGITRYLVAHNFDNCIRGKFSVPGSLENEDSSNSDHHYEEYISLPVFTTTEGLILHLVCDAPPLPPLKTAQNSTMINDSNNTTTNTTTSDTETITSSSLPPYNESTPHQPLDPSIETNPTNDSSYVNNSSVTPCTVNKDELKSLVTSLIHNHKTLHFPPPLTNQQTQHEGTNDDDVTCSDDDYTISNNSSSNINNIFHERKIIIFVGYCNWAPKQLESELLRDVWKICTDGTHADILTTAHNPDLWETISSKNNSACRLLPKKEYVIVANDDDDV